PSSRSLLLWRPAGSLATGRAGADRRAAISGGAAIAAARQPCRYAGVLLVLQTAVLGGEHQVAQERLLVDPQQVRLAALHVGTDHVPVRRDAHQMTERLRIPSPRQFQLAERAVLG